MNRLIPMSILLFGASLAVADELPPPLALSIHVPPEPTALDLWILEEDAGEGELANDTCTVDTVADVLDCEVSGLHDAEITELVDGFQVTVPVNGWLDDHPDAVILTLSDPETALQATSWWGDLWDWIRGEGGGTSAVVHDCAFYYNVHLNSCEDLRGDPSSDWDEYISCRSNASRAYDRCREAASP